MSTNIDPQADMEARWRPSPEQERAVAKYFEWWPNEQDAYTVHIIHNKERGWWSGKEIIEHTPGVFASRDEASAYAQGICYMLAKTGAKATGGWTWHRRTKDGTPAWSVFEDILAKSGQEDRGVLHKSNPR